MGFIHLIMPSDFIQVINSEREFNTKNHYFSYHKIFCTFSLLQKQRLNSRNYSKQALIMELFAYATDDDMHMNAKIQNIKECRYL
jgi:hypothetical protein